MHQFLLVMAIASMAHAASSLQQGQIRHAVEKSIPLLQNTGRKWFTQQSCTSCHHSTLPGIALMTARRHGVAIDEALVREHFRQAFRYLTDLDYAAQGLDLTNSRADVYALWAAHEAGLPPNQASAAMARIVASHQTPDGHWRSLDVRPPQSGSLFSNTALYLQLINWYWGATLDARAKEHIARAWHWLEMHSPESTEDSAFRLFGGRSAGVSAPVLQEWARQVIALQKPDGGWSQIPPRSSDAYATGEVLVALMQAAGIPATDSAIQKGLEFLIRTQLPDGSWLVQSRIHDDAPVSPPYFETGFPHGKNQFTSSSGTSWAVVALSMALPLSSVAPFSLQDLVPPKEPWVDVALFGSNQDLEKLDPNQSTPGGTTALMLVASDISRVKLLLDRGARVNMRSKAGFSAFLVACSYGDNVGVLRLLLDAGAQIDPPAGVKVLFNRSPLMQAVLAGDVDEVRLLVDRHAPVARKELVFGGTPLSSLQMAVLFNDLQTVQYLARNGGLVDEVNGSGVSPLEIAALFDYPDMITLLSQLGADPNHVDKAGMTPLIWASTIEFGSPAAAQALLKAGARPDIVGKGGATALSQATKYRIESIRNLLLPRTVQ